MWRANNVEHHRTYTESRLSTPEFATVFDVPVKILCKGGVRATSRLGPAPRQRTQNTFISFSASLYTPYHAHTKSLQVSVSTKFSSQLRCHVDSDETSTAQRRPHVVAQVTRNLLDFWCSTAHDAVSIGVRLITLAPSNARPTRVCFNNVIHVTQSLVARIYIYIYKSKRDRERALHHDPLELYFPVCLVSFNGTPK